MADTKDTSAPRTRKDSITHELQGTVYKEVEEFHRKSKLQSGQHIIGRMLFLLAVKPEKKTISKTEASMQVAREIIKDWIAKNVYPLSEKNVSKKIERDYAHLHVLLKQYRNKNYKKTTTWVRKVHDFNRGMTANAYDIRTKDKFYQKKMETIYGVKMTDEDEKFYINNCCGSYSATCKTFGTSRLWQKQIKRKKEREELGQRKQMKMMKQAKDEQLTRKTNIDEALQNVNLEVFRDSDYNLPSASGITKNTKTPQTSSATTRARAASTIESQLEKEQEKDFPQIPVRSSRKQIDERIIRCTVQCLADYKVSRRDVTGIIIKTANIIFGQHWSESAELSEPDNDSSDDDSDERIEKQRRCATDLSYIFPSNRCIDKYLEDATYLNLKKAAEYLIAKNCDEVVTIGLDNTTKAAGHKLYDVKADHITVSASDGKRKILTTGYLENTNHCGADSATAYEYKLRCLAVLAGTDVDEIKTAVDFWMTDRAADCEKFFDVLGVEEKKVLKCCAHLILGIDYAIDKVFRDTEIKIGVQKLLNVSAGQKPFLSPSTSIHTLAQIALSKLLSPSHASHSVSLFNEYKMWMDVNNVDHRGFKGFKANRFGRLAEIAKEFIDRRQSILSFFDSIVDANSNKLVLAVSTYIQNDWFVLCSEVYSEIGELIIFPTMKVLGIDSTTASKTKGWLGVKDFFQLKMDELQQRMHNCDLTTGKGRLLAAVIDEIMDTLKRQLGQVRYLTAETIDEATATKLVNTPLSNLGCESEFAKLDNRLKVCGGTTSIQTLSQKNVVTTNAYLMDSCFDNKSAFEKRQEWKWARTSRQTEIVRKMEKDFIATVKQSKLLALQKKEMLKKKKSEKTLKILTQCKKHGGPISADDLNLLDKLDEKSLLLEISYLRLTITPDIRQRRKVKLPNGKFKFLKYSVYELKTAIRNAVKPENNLQDNVDTLLKSVLQQSLP